MAAPTGTDLPALSYASNFSGATAVADETGLLVHGDPMLQTLPEGRMPDPFDVRRRVVFVFLQIRLLIVELDSPYRGRASDTSRYTLAKTARPRPVPCPICDLSRQQE